jgi:hypothetical protein
MNRIFKKIILNTCLWLILNQSTSQTLKFVYFSGSSSLQAFAFITDQKIIIKISPDGKVMEWGNEAEPGRFYAQPGKLQPYMGRVEYFTKQFDSLLNGKVKSIGTTFITYYGSGENAAQTGKIKTIGNQYFEYYPEYENELLRGKLKSAGSFTFSYYTSFENEAYRGCLKSVRSVSLTYYSSFDDKLVRGKIKSIGSYQYSWYTSLDKQGWGGGLKTGSPHQTVEGVAYLLW